MKKLMKNRKGFTLIELIVVIAILGILAAILIPQFSGFQDRANKKAILAEARSAATALEALVAENGDAAIDAAAVSGLSGVPEANLNIKSAELGDIEFEYHDNTAKRGNWVAHYTNGAWSGTALT